MEDLINVSEEEDQEIKNFINKENKEEVTNSNKQINISNSEQEETDKSQSNPTKVLKNKEDVRKNKKDVKEIESSEESEDSSTDYKSSQHSLHGMKFKILKGFNDGRNVCYQVQYKNGVQKVFKSEDLQEENSEVIIKFLENIVKKKIK